MPTCAASSDVAAHRDAVRDLHQVVDLRAGANPRLADRRPIDRRIGADLHVVFDHDAADLRNLVVGAVGAPREPEPVAPDDRAVLQDDAVADDDALADRDTRVHDAVVADDRAGADRDVRVDDRAGADAAPAPMQTNGDRRRPSDTARPTAASRMHAGLAAPGGAKISIARANARYGWRGRIIADGAAGAPRRE